ncbi:O-methyltransferase [Tumebacillus sp. DT12]|uniref:tRNA 5-hydroxyuridine methyltransferase n=1 Tax=Tumebacillus lacus TaxID=2995335 RepID=A0ABT3X0C0_9BACL|nr:O-methyltransferase [Tumebacillus lacus]MCX7570350.1 O-methyltransferase [Tumebacillus lacus]
MMIDPQLVDYLRGFVPERDALLQELEQRAEEGYIPILDLESAGFLRVLLAMTRPQRILEVGTAIGYSTIWFGRHSEAQITTMERDPERAAEARVNLQRAGLGERVELLEGDALDMIEGLGMYDLIFLDAAKGQYPRFLELLTPHLTEGGVLLSDNVLFQGMVSGEAEVKHKLRTMINRLREYNQLIAAHPAYVTTFLPLGDGLAISVKKA